MTTIISRQTLATDWFTNADNIVALTQPVGELSDAEMDLFTLGRSFFTIPWVAAPSATTARDGLGPLFNANTCAACHGDNSSTDFRIINQMLNQANGQNDLTELSALSGLVIKLGQPSQHHTRHVQQMLIADPVYGNQIGVNSTGAVKPEGRLAVKLKSTPLSLPDGDSVTLHSYDYAWQTLHYGELAPETTIELRQAPALVGLGLVEHISDEDILAQADPDDADGDGISGRPNWVYEPLQEAMQLGRFGYKASQANVMMQTADAAAHDMGLTNPYFPDELCTSAQTDCQQAPRGRASALGEYDLPMLRLTAIAFYITHFKVPQAQSLSTEAQQGRDVFMNLGCGNCHTPNFTSHVPNQGEVSVSPYSDFLLHDMGVDLAGERAEFLAEPQEWRTTPLWGLRQRVLTQKRFLHDGRAGSLFEAILWHGGEASVSKDAFMQLSATERQSLITFLETL